MHYTRGVDWRGQGDGEGSTFDGEGCGVGENCQESIAVIINASK